MQNFAIQQAYDYTLLRNMYNYKRSCNFKYSISIPSLNPFAAKFKIVCCNSLNILPIVFLQKTHFIKINIIEKVDVSYQMPHAEVVSDMQFRFFNNDESSYL
jgi:hypothetical protein